MSQPLVSVITVTRNNAAGLRRTLQSIVDLQHPPGEVIVIDGQSTDDTPAVLKAFEHVITRYVSEPDVGIYDAMNKGLALASGTWLIYMNAGDCFASTDALDAAMAARHDDTKVIYSDALFGPNQKIAACSHNTMRIIHQSLIYQRKLHQAHGPYLNMPGVTISDYLFFMAIRHHLWVKSPSVIAHCEGGGVSDQPGSYDQKLAVDLMTGRRGHWLTGVMLLAYPCYRTLLRPIVRLLRPGKI